MQKKLEENNLSETDKTDTLNELEVKTLQLEKICQYQTRGTIIDLRRAGIMKERKIPNTF